MKILYNYLNDSDFLKELTKEHVKTYYVRITVLSWDEEPVSSIEGQVISASLNIDGQSSLRRTGNLSIAIDDTMSEITNTENVLSINKKMALEIGYVNTTNKYKDYSILWFPLGIYIIMSCSISESSSGLVASLQLQDKMCLLNGTAGGTIPAAADLHTIDTINKYGEEVVQYVPIYQIIQELVNHWGGEQLGKIIISDLDNKIKQVMKWGLNKPLYILTNGQQELYFIDEDSVKKQVELWKNQDKKNGVYPETQNEEEEDKNLYPVKIFQNGQDVGYIYTDFVYPGELIADAGSTITDMLDKIIQVLGNFEYFYDLDGNFIFQEKKNFLNNAQSKYILDAINNRQLLPDYIAANEKTFLASYLINMTGGSSVFQFEDSTLITSYSNTPQYGNIKNDFVIWGIRTDIDGNEIPLRYHLAIDEKPMLQNITYLMFNYKEYPLDKYGIWKMPILIGNFSEYGNPKIKLKEGEIFSVENALNFLGLYFYDGNQLFTVKKNPNTKILQMQEVSFDVVEITPTDWRTQLLVQGAAAQCQGLEPNYYYAELKNEWPKIYDLVNQKYFDQVIKNPSGINYFLDFINLGNPKISELSVNNIGRRSYITDKGKNVNCVFEDWIPDVILIKIDQSNISDTEQKQNEAKNRGWIYSQIPEVIYDNLKIGGVHYSAYEEIRQTLHDFTNYNESITLQTIPLYFLQPNTRISVYNPNSNINGDYLINSLSFSLDNEGLLTINASKAVERI